MKRESAPKRWKVQEGFGRTARAGGSVSEPCSTVLSTDHLATGWGQELVKMLA